MSERLERARAAWGIVPDYVVAIVSACDAPNASQNKVAKRLGYSGAVISQVITNSYPGDAVRIEQAVRMHLMGSKVDCPALGEIKELQCVDWQEEARKKQHRTPFKGQMRRACHRCDRFKGRAS